MLFKLFAVGVMRNNRLVMRELEIYFCHLKNPGCPSGFSDQTISGRIISGDVGGSVPCSCVPKGVEMSDLEYLQSINRTDLALVALRYYDICHSTKLWDYIQARYRLRLKIADLMVCFDVSKATCMRWQSDALSLIYTEIV